MYMYIYVRIYYIYVYISPFLSNIAGPSMSVGETYVVKPPRKFPDVLQEAELPEASWRPLLFCALSVTSLKHLRHFPGARDRASDTAVPVT